MCVSVAIRLLHILFLAFGDDDEVCEDKQVELLALDHVAIEQFLLHL